jgi:DNA-binding NtrC family response regulator
MPGMDGFEFLGAVKASGNKAPFVMLTSEGSLTKAMSTIKEGAFDYVRKPIDKDELLGTVERALRYRKIVG